MRIVFGVLVLAVALAGCGPVAPVEEPTASSTPTPTPRVLPERIDVDEPDPRIPFGCEELLSAQFLASGWLGAGAWSPSSPNSWIAPTLDIARQQAGHLTCDWRSPDASINLYVLPDAADSYSPSDSAVAGDVHLDAAGDRSWSSCASGACMFQMLESERWFWGTFFPAAGTSSDAVAHDQLLDLLAEMAAVSDGAGPSGQSAALPAGVFRDLPECAPGASFEDAVGQPVGLSVYEPYTDAVPDLIPPMWECALGAGDLTSGLPESSLRVTAIVGGGWGLARWAASPGAEQVEVFEETAVLVEGGFAAYAAFVIGGTLVVVEDASTTVDLTPEFLQTVARALIDG